jgi:hypothetical protein
VLLEMRKSVQKDFLSEWLSKCVQPDACDNLEPITGVGNDLYHHENGRHVLSQTLVAAVDADKAYVLSYAGRPSL